MAGNAALSTGISVTVDATQVDSKFAESAANLNKTLSKATRDLGVFYDENKLLNNSLGQCVEGLSRAQIKLGYHVDELGRVRTAQEGFVDGLTKSQQAMGFYVDELGDVHNATGKIVGKTAEAARALEKEAVEAAKKAAEAQKELERQAAETTRALEKEAEKAARALEKEAAETEKLNDRAKSAFDGALGAVDAFGGQFATLLGVLEQTDGAIGGASRSLIAFSEGASAAVQAFQGARELLLFWRTMKLRTDAASASQAIYNALVGNWPALIAAAAVGGATVFATYKAGASEIETAGDAFDKLAEKARAAGREIQSAADAAKFGFSEKIDVETYSKEVEALEQIERRIAAQRLAVAEQTAFNAAVCSGGMGSGGAGASADWGESERLDALYAERDAANARLVEAQGAMIDAVVENSRTELEKLEIEKADYEALLKQVEGRRGEAETRKYLALLDEKIVAEKQKELDATLKTAEEEEKRAREARREASGISDYLSAPAKKAAKTVEAFAETVAEWEKSVGIAIDADEFAAAKAEYARRVREALFASTGIDPTRRDAAPANALNAAREQYQTALENGVVSQNEYNEALVQFAAALESERTAKRDAEGYARLLSDAAALDAEAQTIEKQIASERKRYLELTRQGVLTEQERVAANAALDKIEKANAAQEKAARREKDEQERASTRSALGVDALMESLKTPLEKFRETTDAIQRAFQSSAIDRLEREALLEQANAKYWQGRSASTKDDGGIGEKLASQKKQETVETFGFGSRELYLAQIKSGDDYRARVARATSETRDFAKSTAVASERTADQIETLAALKTPRVWGAR